MPGIVRGARNTGVKQTYSLTLQICALWFFLLPLLKAKRMAISSSKKDLGACGLSLSFLRWGSFLSPYESFTPKPNLNVFHVEHIRWNLFFLLASKLWIIIYQKNWVFCFLCIFLLGISPIQSIDQSKLSLHLDPSFSSGCIFFLQNSSTFSCLAILIDSSSTPVFPLCLHVLYAKARVVILKQGLVFLMVLHCLLNKGETS